MNCKGVTHFPYFCEFCGENFCAKCTVKEAHDENYITTTDVLGCKEIHQSNNAKKAPSHDSTMEVDDVDKVTELDKSADIAFCQCRKSNDIENYKCKDCDKIFCKNCPTGPVGEHCLECILVEFRPATSTPKRKLHKKNKYY